MLNNALKFPFSRDPGIGEAWWWLAVPFLSYLVLLYFSIYERSFYNAHIHPEGYGALELLHFFIPVLAAIIALSRLPKRRVRKDKLLFWTFLMLALGSIYIAGEEHSWGQHYFGWQTPDFIANLNRQEETNLHNMSNIFDDYPRTVVVFAILGFGPILPFLLKKKPELQKSRYLVLVPPFALVPTAFMVLVCEVMDLTTSGEIFPRTSEVSELYYYMFILFYVVVLSRRVEEGAASRASVHFNGFLPH